MQSIRQRASLDSQCNTSFPVSEQNLSTTDIGTSTQLGLKRLLRASCIYPMTTLRCLQFNRAHHGVGLMGFISVSSRLRSQNYKYVPPRALHFHFELKPTCLYQKGKAF